MQCLVVSMGKGGEGLDGALGCYSLSFGEKYKHVRQDLKKLLIIDSDLK